MKNPNGGTVKAYPSEDFCGVQVFRVWKPGQKLDDRRGTEVWVSTIGARCCRCSSKISAMSDSCVHAKAVIRYMKKGSKMNQSKQEHVAVSTPSTYTPKYPTTGGSASTPPMAGWWGVELNGGDEDSPPSLWWDGARWFDSRGRYYPHVGHWYGLVDQAEEYDYPTMMPELLMPEHLRRVRVQFPTTVPVLASVIVATPAPAPLVDFQSVLDEAEREVGDALAEKIVSETMHAEAPTSTRGAVERIRVTYRPAFLGDGGTP